MVRTACIFIATLAAASPALAAGCHVDPFRAPHGIDTDVHMTAKSGTPCKIRMNGGSISGINISGPAQHGTAMLKDERIVYTSNSGFSGNDQFIFEKYGESFVGERGQHFAGTSHFTVSVDVTP